MKCKKCGSEIKEGHMYCDVCGEEIRIVPDFDVAIDDSLVVNLSGVIDEINGSDSTVNADTKEITIEDISVTKEIINNKKEEDKRISLNFKSLIVLALVCLLAMFIISIVFYKVNRYYSYDIQYEKAFEQFSSEQYEESVKTVKHVIKLKPDEARPKLLLCDNYYELGKYDEALAVLESLMEQNPGDMNIYERLVKNYEAKGDNSSITELITDTDEESVKYKYGDYLQPEVKINPEGGTYTGDLTVTLECDEDSVIYYTIDGSNPDEKSLKYTDPIELSSGETVIKAICINSKGITSEIAESAYIVELEMLNLPEVTPLSGRFTSPQLIEIRTEPDLKYYYTIDNADPTEDSILYEGPFAMNIGTHTYKFAAFSENGSQSETVEREYTLDIVNLVSMGTAVTNLKMLLDVKGHVVDEKMLKCEQAALIGGATYYIISEYKEEKFENSDSLETDVIDVKTGTIYAVDVLTGLTFNASFDKASGKYSLSAW